MARVSTSRFTKMAKNPKRKAASPELAPAEERVEAIADALTGAEQPGNVKDLAALLTVE